MGTAVIGPGETDKIGVLGTELGTKNSRVDHSVLHSPPLSLVLAVQAYVLLPTSAGAVTEPLPYATVADVGLPDTSICPESQMAWPTASGNAYIGALSLDVL